MAWLDMVAAWAILYPGHLPVYCAWQAMTSL